MPHFWHGDMTALRDEPIPFPERKPDVRTEADDARMDLRVARLDHLTTLNGQRQYAYRIAQFAVTGYIDAALALCGEMQREAVEGIEKLGRRK